MLNSKDAEDLLRKSLIPYNSPTDYIASFRTIAGREIALERNRVEGFYVWVQKYTTDIDGVSIENIEFPGKPYLAAQSRNSNLNDKNSPKLKLGKKVWYLKADNIESLIILIDWYKSL